MAKTIDFLSYYDLVLEYQKILRVFCFVFSEGLC